MDFEPGNVIISTYDTVRRDIEQLAKFEFEVIVFDEAQIIKNVAAGRSSAVRLLNGKYKVCLTGTPLENHIGEFISILELAVPGLMDTSAASRNASSADNSMIITRSKPFVLRRTKENILKDLPEKIESTVFLPLSSQQRSYYDRILTEVREEVRRLYENHSPGRAGILAITALLRLRQLCISPAIIDASYTELSPKTDYLLTTLSELQAEGHSALVFSQFKRYIDLLQPLLKARNIPFIQIDGQTTMAERKKRLAEFDASPEPMVALMTLKTGGIGLNLIKASYVFHTDPWWNPAAFDQIMNQGLSRSSSKAITRQDLDFLLG
ncbi:DEAD/DEAH box helicase [bacterium]|nr:DEAD/DEAH box helicase [bacterium]